ncbi:uncharacterized protein LOC111388162 [Olea europaea var. sylvestris]|uniref:uncharacterized protein LOC111388162 n=1 Tax=Olea europaea var. sylvestris TaxID=158386 RepID=UPI000C1D3AD6|nr:uncharacterized protein LOC111388162 [Olea europaea var. sylvestris]
MDIWERKVNKDDSPLLKKVLDIRDSILGDEGTLQASMDRLICWMETRNFCISAAYDFCRPNSTKVVWIASVWNAPITHKHAFILWLSVKTRLLNKNKIKYLDLDCRCVLHGLTEETVRHLFFYYPFSSSVWGKIRRWLAITCTMSNLSSAVKWMRKEARGMTWQSKVKKIALATSVYYIWMARNKKIFKDLEPHVDCVARYTYT